MNDWHYKTEQPDARMKCLFYDDQTGQQFIDFGNTVIPYTYWMYI